MCLYMLLKVLRPLEGLAAEFASMWLQGDVDTDVRGDVVALHNSDATITPSTGQIQVVGTLATDMALADMILFFVVSSNIIVISVRWNTHVKLLCVRRSLTTGNPLALEYTICAALKWWYCTRLLKLVLRLLSLRVLVVMMFEVLVTISRLILHRRMPRTTGTQNCQVSKLFDGKIPFRYRMLINHENVMWKSESDVANAEVLTVVFVRRKSGF